MGITAGVMTGASSLLTVSQAYGQKKALQIEGDYQNDLGIMNARFAEMQASDAINRGDDEASRIHQQAAQLIGTQRVAAASQNISVDSGSAKQIQEDTVALSNEDAIRAKNNAWREAWGYKVDAVNSRATGAMAKAAANAQAASTMLTAGASVAQQGASYAGNQYKASKATKSKTSSEGLT